MNAKKRSVPDADDFPTLAQFVAGYLHEDYMLEHRTAAGARDAFLRDANPAERAAFARDADRYCADADGLPWSEVLAAFASFGGAWRPASRAELRALLQSPARGGAKGRAGQAARRSS